MLLWRNKTFHLYTIEIQVQVISLRKVFVTCLHKVRLLYTLPLYSRDTLRGFFGETQRFIVKDCVNLTLYALVPTVTISTKRGASWNSRLGLRTRKLFPDSDVEICFFCTRNVVKKVNKKSAPSLPLRSFGIYLKIFRSVDCQLVYLYARRHSGVARGNTPRHT